MKKTKIIANYLPQFHSIPENDSWWGKGYTDWVAVKKSKPLFKGHVQPKEPENDNYYSLDNKDEILRQAMMAKESGIYGFGIYHYWFSSDMVLLKKPAELLLDNSDIEINFMFIWDNGSWKRTWSNVKRGNDWAPAFDEEKEVGNQKNDTGLLAELVYGNEEDWKEHFNYLLPFFKDKRYIKQGNKPLFAFFQPDNDYETISQMCSYWNNMAVNAGFDGMCFISKENYKNNSLEYSFKYEPLSVNNRCELFSARLQNLLNRIYPRLRIYDYDRVWKKIIKFAEKCKCENLFYGAFVSFDDSPRRGKKSKVVLGQSPEKFYYYMRKLVDISERQDKEFIFLTAWNEWGEGAYLEPDKENGNAYLEAIRKVMR